MKKIFNILKLLILMGAFICLSLNVEDLHERYLLSRKGSSVVSVTNEAGNSGGTGFHIKAPSGKTYIMTNAHVCAIGEATGTVFVSQDDFDRPIPRKILEVSQHTDLCLIEPLAEGLPMSLASGAPYTHEEVYVLGHPRLYPLTLNKGRIITEMPELTVMVGIIQNEEDEAACKAPKNKIQDIKTLFGDARICTVVISAYLSTVQILPGNSGSPIVNKFGNVVAVAFAGDRSSNWGAFVVYADIVKFLKYY